MSILAPFKRLILRAVLRNVSPMVIRILAVPDSLLLHEFDAVFRAVLGWDNIGFLFRVHCQEFSSFRRATSSNCGPAKPSSTPAAPSISGSGKSGSWTRNPDRWARLRRCAWAAAAPRRRNTAADPLATADVKTPKDGRG